MINQLNKLVDSLINANKENIELQKKYKLIKKIINKENAFLSMDIEIAYSILRDLQIKEEDIKSIYKELIKKEII
ncbi:MAG: hypothetical protein IKE70_01690 [Bacilli bacterium]|nr:hypothetical protein [Bacilli bacterium]